MCSTRALAGIARVGLVLFFCTADGRAQAGGQSTPPETDASLVMQVQQKLGVQPVDGNYGPRTRAAVQNSQKANGLRPTGKLDQATLAKAGLRSAASAAPPPAPSSGQTVTMNACPQIQARIEELAQSVQAVRMQLVEVRRELAALRWMLVCLLALAGPSLVVVLLKLLARGRRRTEDQEVTGRRIPILQPEAGDAVGVTPAVEVRGAVPVAGAPHAEAAGNSVGRTERPPLSPPPPKVDPRKFVSERTPAEKRPAAVRDQDRIRTPASPEYRWNELYGRLLKERSNLNRALRKTQDGVEQWLQEHFSDLDIEVEWPTPFLLLLGVRNYPKAMAFPRVGPHLELRFLDWFESPHGIGAAVSSVVRPALLDGWHTSGLQMKQRGEVEQK